MEICLQSVVTWNQLFPLCHRSWHETLGTSPSFLHWSWLWLESLRPWLWLCLEFSYSNFNLASGLWLVLPLWLLLLLTLDWKSVSDINRPWCPPLSTSLLCTVHYRYFDLCTFITSTPGPASLSFTNIWWSYSSYFHRRLPLHDILFHLLFTLTTEVLTWLYQQVRQDCRQQSFCCIMSLR